MGLDMYLKAELYVSGYDHQDSATKSKYAKLLKLAGLDRSKVSEDSPSASIGVNVGYWRKSNQIHNWFVQNVQAGKDECRPHYVSREKLEDLRNTCREVLSDHEKAEELLPAQGGFFFGSTDYDDWYFKDLEHTVEILNRCLDESAFSDEWDFHYQSSW